MKKKVKDTQEKRKEVGGIFVQIPFLVLLKQESLKYDSCISKRCYIPLFPNQKKIK